MSGLSITLDASQTTIDEYPPFPMPIIPSTYTISSSVTATKSSSRTKTVEAAQERLWNELSSLYADNEQLDLDSKPLSKNKDGSPTDDIASKLDNLLDSFINGADVVLNELSVLGNAHPFLAIAIFAFHEVVKLDIARRENNKKVLIVIMQMQSMMGPMFQLRNLDRDHMPPAERDFHEGRLKQLVEIITQNIKECRSDISHFINRKFMLKLVLAKGYEKKFATHMEVFALRRSELQSIISEYLAVGMSSANIALSEVGKKLDVMDDKLERIISKLFRNLDTQRERDVFKFMQQNGGPEKCVNDLDLLPKLISKAGESHTMTGSSAVYDQKGLENLQKQLREALAEDLDKVLEKHYSRFEKILQVQSNNLQSMSTYLEDQGVLMQVHATKLGKILDTVTTIMVMEEGKIQTRAVKLKDPEIQRVWDRMNLTSSSVKAKVFVLTFRDHIRTDNSVAGTPTINQAALPGLEQASSELLRPDATDDQDKDSEQWVLDYIDVAYVQPIVEAMDEDGSGFISVKEANSFALARPKGLSLLHWIAYWAAGWHINLINYKKEIYSVLLEMYELLPSIHVANRKLVDDFLENKSLRRIEALLRSIKPLPDSGRKEPKLGEVASVVASSQLERLEKNLNEMGYYIESAADAATIGGSSRIETWILPLVLLLLRRHLRIIRLAQSIVLDSLEFDAHTTSLASVFTVFNERMESVEAKFRQLHSNVNAQFEIFAYGMFLAAFKKTELNTSENTLLSLKMDEYNSLGSSQPVSGQQPRDISILSKPVGPPFEPDELLDIAPSEGKAEDHTPLPIEGNWLALTIDNTSGWRDPYLFVIRSSGENTWTANAQAYYKTMEITNGKFNAKETSDGRIVVTFDQPYLSQTFEGTYDPEKEVIEGSYADMPVVPVEQEEAEDTQTTAESEAKEGGEANISIDGETNQTPLQEAEATSGSNQDTGESSHSNVAETESMSSPVHESSAPVDSPSTSPEDTRVWLGRFYMRRTPSDVFRFRYLLDGPGPAPCWGVWPTARKRWAFAIEAVLHRTRRRMGSRRAFLDILLERRKWLTYGQQWYLTDSDSSPERWYLYEPLSGTQWEEYQAMLWGTDPTIARLYEKLCLYFMQRGKWNIGWWYCDSCSKTLAFTRYQCIVCMEDDLSHTIDLCDRCFDKHEVVHGAGNLTHLPSHSLLRSRRPVHNFEIKTLIAESRLISERSKQIFRDQEKKPKEAKEHGSRKISKGKFAKKEVVEIRPDDSTKDVVQICACCSKPVAPPCWVCVSCSPLTFICDSCDRKSLPVIQAGRNHSRMEHHLLRIHDSIEVKPIKTNDMERQLDQINTSISGLEEKFKAQLEEVKVVVNEVAKSVGVQEDDVFLGGLTDDELDELDVEKLGKTETAAEEKDEASLEKGLAESPEDTSVKSGDEERSVLASPGKDSARSKTHMDLIARLSMLETEVEHMHQKNQAIDDRFAALGSRFDTLEANMNRQFEALLTRMQQLLSPPLPN